MSAADFLELARGVHWPAVVPVLLFWVRWERWARRHRAEHDKLQRLVPHEVTHG